MTDYYWIFLGICLMALPGGACRDTTDTDGPQTGSFTEREEPLSPETSKVAPSSEQEDPEREAQYEPVSMGDRILIEPAEPSTEDEVRVRGGPITFRNGCEGLERAWAEGPREDGSIILRWSFRPVPPDALCTMALHSQWLEVILRDLAAGEYRVVAPGIGEEIFKVHPAGG